MTDDRMALSELVEKGADGDLEREMLAFTAEQIMELEVEARTGAGHGSRSLARTNYHNDYRERPWETRAGRVDLEIPKLRKGTYLPSFLEPRRTDEKALVAVIQGAYVKGGSTRSVDDLTKVMGRSGISKSQVNLLVEEIDEGGVGGRRCPPASIASAGAMGQGKGTCSTRRRLRRCCRARRGFVSWRDRRPD